MQGYLPVIDMQGTQVFDDKLPFNLRILGRKPIKDVPLPVFKLLDEKVRMKVDDKDMVSIAMPVFVRPVVAIAFG